MVDNAEEKKSVNELNQEVRQLKQRLNQLNDQKEGFFSEREQVGNQIKQLISEIQEEKKKRNTLTDEVKLSKIERDKLNKEIQEKVKVIKDIAPVHSRVNPHQLKRTIEKLEENIEISGMNFNEEKKLMKKIKELKKEYDKVKEIEEARSVGKALSKLRKSADSIHKSVQIKAEESQKTHEGIIETSQSIDELKKKETALREQFLAKKKEFSETNAQLKEKLFILSKSNANVQEVKKEKRKTREAQQKQTLQEKKLLVEEKFAKGEKLTNEDLLILQGAEGLN